MAAQLRIAVADDEVDMRQFLERFIPHLGHVVSSVAATGRQLVEHCRTAAPDLIITDVKMPEMSGLEAVEAVGRFASIPSILLTAHSDERNVARARELGVMAYLVKPITERHLAPAIVLARRHFEEAQRLRAEAAELRQALEDRKLIERAKGVLTHRSGLSEETAYQRMRRLATSSNRKLVDIARQVLQAEEMLRAVEVADGGNT